MVIIYYSVVVLDYYCWFELTSRFSLEWSLKGIRVVPSLTLTSFSKSCLNSSWGILLSTMILSIAIQEIISLAFGSSASPPLYFTWMCAVSFATEGRIRPYPGRTLTLSFKLVLTWLWKAVPWRGWCAEALGNYSARSSGWPFRCPWSRDPRI